MLIISGISPTVFSIGWQGKVQYICVVLVIITVLCRIKNKFIVQHTR